ncbi:MAG: UvrD-helicase domain-containing protein [Proteobacteria bacterium]|nr:UvrD-helicase domain-containing protein [Pseudomonadota bacterium]
MEHINKTNTDYLNELNAEQRIAVTTVEGSVLILAGAGTGKTKALTTRLAHIIKQGHATPNEILAVTFTNKAAAEMAERVEDMLGHSTNGMWLGTFHSLCSRILRKHCELVDLGKDFIIIGIDDQKKLLSQIYQDAGINDKDFPVRQTMGILSRWKDEGKSPEDLTIEEKADIMGMGGAVYKTYQQRLLELNACDFGDLLLYVMKIFKENHDVLREYQDQFKYIMVDEYQDTNAVQYLWLRLLALLRKNICVVGDDDQSIYAFRGAIVGNILKFEEDFPNSTVVRLEQNYRSTGNILKGAGAVIKCNSHRHEKELWTSGSDGSMISLFPMNDEYNEAKLIAAQLKKYRSLGGAWAQFCVLVRTMLQTRPFEEAFNQNDIPYQVVGGQKFYERKEVRDAIAYLRITYLASDDLAFERIINVPKRGIGDTTVKLIRQQARAERIPMLEVCRSLLRKGIFSTRVAKQIEDFLVLIDSWKEVAAVWSPSELIERILEESGYVKMLRDDPNKEDAKTRIDNLKDLLRATDEHDNISDFLEHVALITEGASENINNVKVMTVHAAKGLEFDTVFLPGCEENIFPHKRSIEEGFESVEEERRLMYVAMTRAKKNLIITYAQTRRKFGQNAEETEPSRFLAEIPDGVLKVVNLAQKNTRQNWAQARKNKYQSQPQVDFDSIITADQAKMMAQQSMQDMKNLGYEIGKRVFHKQFGYGKIEALEGAGQDRKVIVIFEKHGKKKLLAVMANLDVR